MTYAVKKERDLSGLQSSYALARKVENNYREMINTQLIHSLERMAQDDYQATKMPENFHRLIQELHNNNIGFHFLSKNHHKS